MIELHTYKLINAVLNIEVPEVKNIDLFRNQYNNLTENIRPFNDANIFIEFLPRTDILTRDVTLQYGKLNVKYHVLCQRPDNNSSRKKNINDEFKVFELATKVNRVINTINTSQYLSGTTVHNLLLDEAKYYALESGSLVSTEITHTDEFTIIILNYVHTYVDNSAFRPMVFSTGWTYTVSDVVFTTPNSLIEADFNNDFDTTQFDTPEVYVTDPLIYFRQVVVSGNTVTIDALAFNDEGIPLNLEYSIETGVWQSSNVFTGVAVGVYNVIIRDSRGRGLSFSMNPITV
jgi:hypothetical protein